MTNNLYVISLNYQELNTENILNLKNASFPKNKLSYMTFVNSLDIREFAIIQKCNSIMFIVISSSSSYPEILALWENISLGGIKSINSEIQLYSSTAALIYLYECSVGIHSVVIGDSQVYGQMKEGIKNSIKYSKYDCLILKDILVKMKLILKLVQKETMLNKGTISLERIACNLITTSNKRVGVVGLGRSGKLILQILTKETNLL